MTDHVTYSMYLIGRNAQPPSPPTKCMTIYNASTLFYLSAMKRSRELTLKKLREAARVNYKTAPVRTINEIKRLFLKSIKQDSLTFIKIPVHARFLFFTSGMFTSACFPGTPLSTS